MAFNIKSIMGRNSGAPKGLAHIPREGMFTTPPKNSRYPK